jgi:glutaminyl-peptide cyclotransferase
MRIGIALVLALLVIVPTITISGAQEGTVALSGCQLSFDGDLANESVSFQTSLGPRIPGSEASSALRDSIKSNLSGWHITESTHHSNEMVLTNLYATWNKGAGSTVMLAAHYDSRAAGDKDWNESRHDEPIDGANDGASGVAVLLELARHIPSMNLTHEVTLFFTDGEDQGDYNDQSGWILGAKAWAENLTQEEADSIESFILVDMIGDSNLTIRKTNPGNSTLWNRTENKIVFLDEVCGLGSSDYFDFERYDGIYDDHVPAHELGIPAIDIIDTRYGENASYLGGHWHTHNDTDDKVSAESLQKIGFILESGLITGAWSDIRFDENPVTDDKEIEEESNEKTDEIEEGKDGNEIVTGILLVVCILLVWGNLVWLIFADTEGEG